VTRVCDSANPCSGTTPTWDCTSTDWELHSTSDTELLCKNDYQTVLSAANGLTDLHTVAHNFNGA
jgi:hypothetical protein